MGEGTPLRKTFTHGLGARQGLAAGRALGRADGLTGIERPPSRRVTMGLGGGQDDTEMRRRGRLEDVEGC